MAIVDLIETKKCIFICNGGSCNKLGAEEMTLVLRAKIARLGLHESTHTVRTKCIGRCDDAPVVFTVPDCSWHKNITVNTVNDFIEYYLLNLNQKSKSLFFTMGQQHVNSESIPTNKRKKIKRYDL